MSRSSVISPESPARSPWIIAPAADLALVILTPAALIGALTAAKYVWTPAQITSFALVWAIGHHLPGMMRAYGDRALFQRFQMRFLVAPLILIVIGVYSSVTESSAIPLGVGMWGWWHYLMQAYGFIRIYDAKVGSVDQVTCRLDQAMCLAWFAAPVALTSNGLFSYLNLFYKAGGPVVPTSVIRGFQHGVLGAVIVVSILFLANAAHQTRRGRPPSRLKLALMVSNFAYYWYCLATVSNLLISYALYELFHDVQYLTIVWAFNQQRAARDQGAGGFTRFLFRKRWWLVAAYVALIVGYGLLNYATRTAVFGPPQRVLLGLFVASTVLHYYYDGFIWKLRESETRRPLGLSDVPSTSRRWRPAWTWSLAAVPLCGLVWLAVAEHRLHGAPLSAQQLDALAAALPQSVFTHLHRGIRLADSGQFEAAEAEYVQARLLNPYYAEVPYNLGALLSQTGRIDEAQDQFREAIRLDPRHVEANFNMGVLSMRRGRLRDALPYFETALRVAPDRAEVLSNYGAALLMNGKPRQAEEQLHRALRLQPDLAEAHANLAQALSARGALDAALTHARRAADLQPESASARYNLGILLERLQRLDDAVDAYRQAASLQPDDSSIWNNLGVALAKQNRLDDAIDAFRRAVALAPDNLQAQQNLQRAESLRRGDAE